MFESESFEILITEQLSFNFVRINEQDKITL